MEEKILTARMIPEIYNNVNSNGIHCLPVRLLCTVTGKKSFHLEIYLHWPIYKIYIYILKDQDYLDILFIKQRCICKYYTNHDTSSVNLIDAQPNFAITIIWIFGRVFICVVMVNGIIIRIYIFHTLIFNTTTAKHYLYILYTIYVSIIFIYLI